MKRPDIEAIQEQFKKAGKTQNTGEIIRSCNDIPDLLEYVMYLESERQEFKLFLKDIHNRISLLNKIADIL